MGGYMVGENRGNLSSGKRRDYLYHLPFPNAEGHAFGGH